MPLREHRHMAFRGKPSADAPEPHEPEGVDDFSRSAAAASESATGDGNGAPDAAPAKHRHRFIDYPRLNKTGFRRWIPSWRVWLASAVSFVLLICGSAFAVYAAIP